MSCGICRFQGHSQWNSHCYGRAGRAAGKGPPELVTQIHGRRISISDEGLERVVMLLWAGAILFVCVRVAIYPNIHNTYRVLANAGRDWMSGRHLYAKPMPFYRYSPLVAALVVPFAILPFRLGGVAWRLLNAAVYFGGLSWWSRQALPRKLAAGSGYGYCCWSSHCPSRASTTARAIR